jgi:hypothetical protein
MTRVELAFDSVDELDHVFLIAARKCHGGHGLLNRHEGIVYCGELSVIHGQFLNLRARSRKACVSCGQKKSGLVAPQPAKRGVFGKKLLPYSGSL